MKLIYAQGFSKNEKLEWKPVVFSNVIQSFKTIQDAMQELNIDFEDPANEVRPTPCIRAHDGTRLAPPLCLTTCFNGPRRVSRGVGTILIIPHTLEKHGQGPRGERNQS